MEMLAAESLLAHGELVRFGDSVAQALRAWRAVVSPWYSVYSWKIQWSNGRFRSQRSWWCSHWEETLHICTAALSLILVLVFAVQRTLSDLRNYTFFRYLKTWIVTSWDFFLCVCVKRLSHLSRSSYDWALKCGIIILFQHMYHTIAYKKIDNF